MAKLDAARQHLEQELHKVADVLYKAQAAAGSEESAAPDAAAASEEGEVVDAEYTEEKGES